MLSVFQLLLAPTPFIIGITNDFMKHKQLKKLPGDIWLIDLDSGEVPPPPPVPTSSALHPSYQHHHQGQGSPPGAPYDALPEPEASILRHHLQQVLDSIAIQPIKNLEDLSPERLQRMTKSRGGGGDLGGGSSGMTPSHSPPQGCFTAPFIFGNDVDSIDVSTRVAMVHFLVSPNTLANFSQVYNKSKLFPFLLLFKVLFSLQHIRVVRLLPRPIVAINHNSLMNSRAKDSPFVRQFVYTQVSPFLQQTSILLLRV